MRHTVALFGEAEKGQFKRPYAVSALPELVDLLGQPPPDSEGLFFAIQALLYHRNIVYFRVVEEGFSRIDYLSGLKYLATGEIVQQIDALCLPGVGDLEILDASEPICMLFKSHLITSQKDLYDYLTNRYPHGE